MGIRDREFPRSRDKDWKVYAGDEKSVKEAQEVGVRYRGWQIGRGNGM